MNLKSLAQFIVAACLVAIAWTSMGVPSAKAQQGPRSTAVSLNLESVDVRDALRQLFNTNSLSYAVDPNVTGSVTVRLRNVGFDTALQNICRQSGLTYRVEAGVYQIVLKEPDPDVAGPEMRIQQVEPPLQGMPRMTPDVAITLDDHFLYVVRGLQVFKLDKSNLHVVGRATLPPTEGFGSGFGRSGGFGPTPR